MLGSLSLVLPLVPFLGGSAGEAPQWGGFRGNDGTGVAGFEDLPEALGEEQIAWRTELPGGYSSPVVAGDLVLVTATEEERLLTIALDRKSGEVLWDSAIEFDGKRPGGNSSAAPTPATDGERVYVVFHHVGLVAYDLGGKELWRKPIGPFNIPHGMAASPLVHGDSVVLLVDQDKDPYLVAYDKVSGAERWKVARAGVAHGYATPAIHVPAEGPAQVIVSGSFQIAGYSLQDGAKLWWVEGNGWQTKCMPTVAEGITFVNGYMPPSGEFGVPRGPATWEEALAAHDADDDGRIAKAEWNEGGLHQVWFIYDQDDDGTLQEEEFDFLKASATRIGGLFAVRLGGSGDVTESHVLWTYDDRRGLPDGATPLAYQGVLYLLKDGGLMTAVDPATGEILKQARVGEPDGYWASPVAADGKLYLAGHSGQLSVLRAGAEWEPLAVSHLEEEVWATPALAEGQVFVRSMAALYCFEEPAGD